jgi:hypothetical protein
LVELPGKAAGQGLHAMVQNAESMVKFYNNAVFCIMCPQEQQQQEQQQEQQSKT